MQINGGGPLNIVHLTSPHPGQRRASTARSYASPPGSSIDCNDCNDFGPRGVAKPSSGAL